MACEQQFVLKFKSVGRVMSSLIVKWIKICLTAYSKYSCSPLVCLSNDTKIAQFANEWGKYKKVLGDKYMFDDGWFVPYGA